MVITSFNFQLILVLKWFPGSVSLLSSGLLVWHAGHHIAWLRFAIRRWIVNYEIFEILSNQFGIVLHFLPGTHTEHGIEFESISRQTGPA